MGLVVSVNSVTVFAKGDPLEIRLPFEKAVIEYEISGSQKGKETLYIRDFGNERVKVTKSKGKIMFVPVTTDTIEITTRDSVVNIDRNKKTALKITNPQKLMQQEMKKLSATERKIVMKNFETLGMNMAVMMGGEVKQKAGKYLGYSCDVVTMMGTTSCQMSNSPVMLNMKSDLMGIKLNTVAKKIDKNAAVPDDLFRVPANVKVEYSAETDNMNKEMIASMVNTMRDPGAAQKMKEGMAQQKKQMEAESVRENGNETDKPDQEQLNEMMKKGMKSFEGMFK